MKKVILFWGGLFILVLFAYRGMISADVWCQFGDGYYLAGSTSDKLYIYKGDMGKGQIVIAPNVIDYKYDKSFIITKQMPDSIWIEAECKTKYEQGLNCAYYWIIIKETDKIFGPMSESHYHEMKGEYNISLDF